MKNRVLSVAYSILHAQHSGKTVATLAKPLLRSFFVITMCALGIGMGLSAPMADRPNLKAVRPNDLRNV